MITIKEHLDSVSNITLPSGLVDWHLGEVERLLKNLRDDLLRSEEETRPPEHADGENWDRDEEEADVVADVYREIAAKLSGLLS